MGKCVEWLKPGGKMFVHVSVLPYVAVCCSVLQWVALRGVAQAWWQDVCACECVAVCCRVLQWVAVGCVVWGGSSLVARCLCI